MGHSVPTSEMGLGQLLSGKSSRRSHKKRLFNRYPRNMSSQCVLGQKLSLCTLPDKLLYGSNKEGRMPQITKQPNTSELHRQPPQMPSPLMETHKPKSPTPLWLLTGVLVLVLIVMVVA